MAIDESGEGVGHSATCYQPRSEIALRQADWAHPNFAMIPPSSYRVFQLRDSCDRVLILSPAFSYYEDATGQPIAAAIVKLLVSR
jgi:hypothetical protein